MTALVFLLLPILAIGALPGDRQIATRYEEVVRQFNSAIARAQGQKKPADEATQRRNADLEELLRVVPQAQQCGLSAPELNALAEAAELVGRPHDALDFAKLASKRAEDAEPFIALVRCLCALGLVDEAEDATREASHRFPDAEKAYLLHQLLAIRYRACGRTHKAMEHMRAALLLIAKQVHHDSFYSTHLARSACDYAALAIRSGKDNEWRETRDVIVGIIQTELNHRADLCREHGELTQSAVHIKEVSLCSSALLKVVERSDQSLIENVLVDWLNLLIEFRRTTGAETVCRAEVQSLLRTITSSPLPPFSGNRLDEQLKQLEQELKSDADPDAALASHLLAETGKARGLLLQHRRHSKLIGKQLFTADELQKLKRGATADGLIVHLFRPSDDSTPQGLAAFGAAKSQLHDGRVHLCAMAYQSGLSWDARTRRFTVNAMKPPADEAIAIDRLQKAFRLAEPVSILLRDSAAARTLQAEFFPINIALSSNGTVLAIASGAEPPKLNELIAKARLSAGDE